MSKHIIHSTFPTTLWEADFCASNGGIFPLHNGKSGVYLPCPFLPTMQLTPSWLYQASFVPLFFCSISPHSHLLIFSFNSSPFGALPSSIWSFRPLSKSSKMIASMIIAAFSIIAAVAAQNLVPPLTLPDCPVCDYDKRIAWPGMLTILLFFYRGTAFSVSYPQLLLLAVSASTRFVSARAPAITWVSWAVPLRCVLPPKSLSWLITKMGGVT